MNIPSSIQTFHFGNTTVNAFVPTTHWLQKQLNNNASSSLSTGNTTPYWAQVWPAAKALCQTIALQPGLVKNKTVLEIAAGLGLPSLLAVQFAKEVIASDYIPEAVKMMKQSVQHNKIKNMECLVMDWNKPNKKLKPDVLLLSDINYEPKTFDALYKMLAHFIEQGTTVLLSTPQRLMAKPFMEKIEQWCKEKHNVEVKHNDEMIFGSVWVLGISTLSS